MRTDAFKRGISSCDLLIALGATQHIRGFTGQEYQEHGTAAPWPCAAADADPTTMLGDDAICDPETKTGSLLSLSGKKRLKDRPQVLDRKSTRLNSSHVK